MFLFLSHIIYLLHFICTIYILLSLALSAMQLILPLLSTIHLLVLTTLALHGFTKKFQMH